MAFAAGALPASAGECLHPYYWEAVAGQTPKPNNCFGGSGFRCYKALDSEWFFRLKNPACDPWTALNGCVVQLRVPLQAPGVQDMVEEDGLFGSPTPTIYWFEGEETAPTCPGTQTECGQEAICGTAGFGGKINRDFIETWVERGGVTCFNAGQQTGTYSLRVMVCRTGCRVDTTVDGATFDTPKLARDIGCLDPPEEKCGTGDASCRVCTAGGAGPGGGPPGMGGPGSPGTGPKATLRYAGGGAGLPGLPGSAAWNVTLGRYWSHDYAERIVPLPDESRVWLITKYGTYRRWSSLNATTGVYEAVSPSSEKRTLTWLGAGFGWELTGLDGTVDVYDDQGRWSSSPDRNGNTKVATYTGSELTQVTFPDGRHEEFGYDAGSGKLTSIAEVGVDGTTTRVWGYTWNGDDLVRIDRPDGTALLFTYGEATHPGYMTRMELEGSDGTSVRVLRGWEYDVEGNVARTWVGDSSPTGSDAVDVWAFAFDDLDEPSVTTVTDPVGQVITYQLGRDSVSKNVKVLSVNGDCPVCDLGPNAQLSYDDPQNPLLPTQIVDGRGTVTSFTYDAFGQILTRTEADGDAALQRITTWTYDATYPALVTSVEQPSVTGGAAVRRTDWLLDAFGNALERTISGVEAGSGFALTTETTYNAAGQPLTIDPPGYGTADETSFTYDPARGSLVADSRTAPLVGTTIFDHDPLNRRTSETDPNGVETTTAYDELDRVTEARQVGASPPADDLVTAQEYDTFGDLLRTTLPEGNVVEYGYDDAGRLVSIERKPDASTSGERVLYTLDDAGNRTLEELQRWDAGASAWVTHSSTAYEYSTRCHLDRVIQAPGAPEEAVTEYAYDCNGNLVDQWDPNHDAAVDPPTMSYAYDALDRLLNVSQPWAGGGQATTTYGYDVQDHLTSVIDAEGNTTSYTYSDRDLLTQEVSPVSGTTLHGYNDHGELTSTTDARGVLVNRSVDELDRVLAVDYPGTDLDTSYGYDSAPAVCAGASFPVGRLGAITRNGASVESCYDRFGRVTRDGELLLTYDANGNRTGIVYPGGVSALYGFDFADREVSLNVTSPGGSEPVVQSASYLPSGPLSTLVLGSGTTENRAFDGRYAPVAITLTGAVQRTFSYTTDRVGNILEIIEQPACIPGPLVLENQTITTEETFVSCTTIEAGDDFRVEMPGDVAFHAQGTVQLKAGFSVGVGARFVASPGGMPELSHRSYGYQAPQYFLTGAEGPWGDLDWSYDKMGNRTSETRDGGNADVYEYVLNGTSGNTPILNHVILGVGGVRDYTWGPAGHLEEVTAGANVIDLTNDAEGRLSAVGRSAASESAAFIYDGRSFLQTAKETSGGTSSVDPVYDSLGLLQALRRQSSPTSPVEQVTVFYLADRPVAQLGIEGPVETWTYFTTDHLGAPLLATDDIGAITWEGGFEPFGTDYQQGLPESALEKSVYLRLPGQWEDTSWEDASSGAHIYYNVHRWYQPGVGRYSRPDPLGLVNPNSFSPGSTLGSRLEMVYGYAEMNPLIRLDPLGFRSRVCCRLIAGGLLAGARHCFFQIERNDRTTRCGLVGGRFSGQPANTGYIIRDNGYDRVKDPENNCGPWNEDCGTDECVIQRARNYPNPSFYRFARGPNSNSFAGNISRVCGLTRPDVASTPGWNDPPAPPRYIGPQAPPPRPVECVLP